jgi:hypothetical protein
MSVIKISKRYDDYALQTELGHQQKDKNNNLDLNERENNVKLRALKVAERLIKNAIKNKTLEPEYIQTQEDIKNRYIKKYIDAMYDMDDFIKNHIKK